MNRTFILAALLTLGSLSVLQAVSLPLGKASHTVFLAGTPDPDLVGKRVDVVSRILTNNSAVSLEKIVLKDVLVLSIHNNEWAASSPNVTLALSPEEMKKLDKISDRVGVDLLIRSR